MTLDKAGSGSVEARVFNAVVDALQNGTLQITAADIDSQAAQDGEVLTADGSGNATWEAGGGSAWTEHDLSALGTDWTDDGVGTWTFVGDVISQTDATAESAMLYTGTPYPSLDYVMESEIRIPTGQDSGTTAQAVISAGNNNQIANLATGRPCLVGEGAILMAHGSGDGGVLLAGVWLDTSIAGSGAIDTSLHQAEWHTLRAVASPVRQSIYIDGDYFGSNEALSGGNNSFDSSPPGFTHWAGICAVGLVEFRNVKVWTRTLPT